MNMKKNFKRFFTLKHHANDGFTLVELIVVIAILAILGGVAVPAYSGYIEKTKYAADETLLNAVNKAFASACATNGTDIYLVDSAYAVLNDDKTVRAVYRENEGDAYNEAFNMFYEGNEDAAFEVYEELFFHPTLHMFAENAAVTFTFGDTTITLSAEDIAILSGDNAFSNRGAAALLADVGALETYLANGFLDESILGEIGASDDFMNAFAGYMGLKMEDYEDEDAYWTAYEEKLAELEAENEYATTNALIMYAASSAAGTTQDKISNLFDYNEGSSLTSRIEGSNDAETMANAALAYGMYTAYAEKNGIDTTDPAKFSQTVNTKEFADYVASSDGQGDLEAYMAAMNMVSDNTGNPEITSSVLTSGIVGNQDLADLMTNVMGN